MKKLFVIAVVLAKGLSAEAQCNKTITWKGAKTEYLDSTGAVKNTQEAPVTIETNSNHISFTIETGDGRSDIIEGDIKNVSCNWNEAYKNGKTSFKSVLAKSNGETKEATISIEAKDGKISIVLELANMNGMKMRIPVDNYKEKA